MARAAERRFLLDRFGPGGSILVLLAYIRDIEYNWVVQNQLRSYKANVFQALAHPTRIAVIEALRDGELSAGKIQERLSVEQAYRNARAKHLKIASIL